MYFTIPDNTIIAWTIENYHEQGNIIITILLLPLGHISNNDIIFGCNDQRYSDEFAYMMSEEYQMSMMGELKFFLGLQIRQQRNVLGILPLGVNRPTWVGLASLVV